MPIAIIDKLADASNMRLGNLCDTCCPLLPVHTITNLFHQSGINSRLQFLKVKRKLLAQIFPIAALRVSCLKNILFKVSFRCPYEDVVRLPLIQFNFIDRGIESIVVRP